MCANRYRVVYSMLPGEKGWIIGDKGENKIISSYNYTFPYFSGMNQGS
ncbi:hypothetical protein [Candidatus Paracaedibacter symbiosus]|nr:hypothetical protein [Candidatus Paracaedibacter symbiosus]